jgi:hypothetical protein
MSDEYNHVPLKIVDHKELHPMGTAARIRELEAALDAEKAIHTVWLARFGEPATAPHCPTCACSQSSDGEKHG